MRVIVLAAMLLASSSLCAFAQESGKTPPAAPQTETPAQADQNAPSPPDQKDGREQPKTDEREMGPDWKMRRSDSDRRDSDDRETARGGMMHRGDSDRTGRDDREKGHGGMMRRGDDDRMGRDRDKDRGRYQERGDRDRERADGNKDDREYSDAEPPRRRVKICFEFENGDEYCRYRR
ncbi:MAG: hypothetical protein ABIL01_06765 [Pseudomonadota bacterium]